MTGVLTWRKTQNFTPNTNGNLRNGRKPVIIGAMIIVSFVMQKFPRSKIQKY